MKKTEFLQFLSIFIALAISGCALKPQQETNQDGQENLTYQETPLEVFKENLITEFDPALGAYENASRYSINLIIPDEINAISGHEDVRYTNLENVALDQIYFELIPNAGGDYLKVENMKVNGLPVLSVLRFDNSVLALNLDKPLQSGDSLEISMDFSETVPEKMGGNYGLFVHQEDILALDSFFPIIPVFDEKGWHVGSPPRNADMIFTDAAFFEVQVDAPAGLVLAASGVEVDAASQKDRQIVTFAGGPQRDFYLAASPRFHSASVKSGEVKVTSLYPEEFENSGKKVLGTAVKALNVFSKHFGAYPYTELDVVSTPMNAGGMEYSGAAAMALNLYGMGFASGGTPNTIYLEYAVAHEVAHQWFFNQVMNDQLNEPWLDEGFAQYLTYIYFLDIYGRAAADQAVASWERNWAAVGDQPIPIGKPAADYTQNEYVAIIYGRAPLFILELEKKMGSEGFRSFLADYVAEYRWKTTDTSQFKSLAEKHCDCDLTELFNEWWAVE